VNDSPFALVAFAFAAPFKSGGRVPRFFMISIVALYSRMRFAISSRRFCRSLSRSVPIAAGDAGGTASLRTARADSFILFAHASALASSSVTGPVPGIAAFDCALERAVPVPFLAFLRLAELVIYYLMLHAMILGQKLQLAAAPTLRLVQEANSDTLFAERSYR
jgi:hypothetical protein